MHYILILSKIFQYTITASFTHILRLLVSEFTLAENPANTVTSKLRYVCKNEEGILLGICPVKHAHHQTIEDQVLIHLLLIMLSLCAIMCLNCN